MHEPGFPTSEPMPAAERADREPADPTGEEAGRLRERIDAAKRFMESGAEVTREELEAVLSLFATDWGRRLYAWEAVINRRTSDEPFASLAAGWLEQDTLPGGVFLERYCRTLNLPEGQGRAIAERQLAYKEQRELAEIKAKEWAASLRAEDADRLGRAQEEGYEINVASARRAQDEGNPELAYLIYMHLDLDTDESALVYGEEGIRIIRMLRGYGHRAVEARRDRTLAAWARRENPGLLRVMRERFDRMAEVNWARGTQNIHHRLPEIPARLLHYRAVSEWGESDYDHRPVVRNLFAEIPEAEVPADLLDKEEALLLAFTRVGGG